jgi:phospholipid/cholesterol/gamma-HCH transport system ATP-binding protein
MDTATTLRDGETVISVRDLVTHYGDRLILKVVSLEVHAGEIMVIMGGSGSGKSTLLRHLMALETATSAASAFAGSMSAEPPLRNSARSARSWASRFRAVRCSAP